MVNIPSDLCYTPARFATPENLKEKAALFTQRQGSVSFILWFL